MEKSLKSKCLTETFGFGRKKIKDFEKGEEHTNTGVIYSTRILIFDPPYFHFKC